jgi:hypothetical protein
LLSISKSPFTASLKVSNSLRTSLLDKMTLTRSYKRKKVETSSR